MNELRIEATKSSPEILLNPAGMIRIRGRSIHENTLEFYKPVEDWVDTYVTDPPEITCIDMNLEYFNSASAKVQGLVYDSHGWFPYFYDVTLAK